MVKWVMKLVCYVDVIDNVVLVVVVLVIGVMVSLRMVIINVDMVV